MRQIHTEIEIGASARQVWQILTDFASFPEWNPFIRQATGEVREGARLEVSLQISGTKARIFRPIVLKAEPNRELRWLGRLWIPGLFDGEHSFIIEALTEERVHFVQREIFTGLLVPLFSSALEDTRRGFEEMNQALKERVEKLSV
jgi:hypothetical protein